MADTQKTTNQLKIGMETASGKTKYLTLDNPNSDLTEQQVRTTAQYLVDNNVLWNDEDGEDSYTGVVTAYTEVKVTTDFDLEN